MGTLCLGNEFTIQSGPWVFIPAFRCQPLHFVSSFSFLIHKQLIQKEVFPVVTWNIAKCSQSSKQWFHSCRTCLIEVYLRAFQIETYLWLQWWKRIILKQNLGILVQNILEWLILLPFPQANTGSRLRCHCVSFLGRGHQQPPPQTP